MKKPASLRAALTTAFPDLETDPDRLRMWIEKGHVQCWASDNLNFTQRYTLTVVIEGWTLPVIMIWVLLIDWLRIQQPELLTPGLSENAIPFECDVLDATSSDVAFDLQLTEPVRVTRRADGGFDLQVVSEPDPLLGDMAAILPAAPLLETVWLDGVQLVPDDPEA